jgi:tetratricopeptide (TPR) repeat protein
MQENEISHYCQKCLAANPLGQDFCTRCGTRMMIVVEPASLKYENMEAGATGEEHLLERISVLENRLGRLTDRLERSLDLLLRQAQNSYFDRVLLKSLISLLSEDGVVESQKLERVWQDRCEQDAATQEATNRREELRARIITSYRGVDRAVLEQFVNEGFLMIEDGNFERGIQALQRAAEIDSQNGSLLALIGEHFFEVGRTKPALDYLSRAYTIFPENNHVSLLLGLVCGDAGDTERARELLETATLRGGSSFAAHYGLGRLFLAEEQWDKALREFKRALASKPSPEAHYALGCIYFQLNRDELAARHLRKAVALDDQYGEAFHLLGMIHKRGGNDELARRAFDQAQDHAASPERRKKRRMASEDVTPVRLFAAGVRKNKRLMTGGNRRLAEALRKDALKAFLTAGVPDR